MHIGLPISVLQLDGFRSRLQDGERTYLDSLGLGNPQSIQDYFLITEDGDHGRVTRAVCVLYPGVLLLFRYHTESSLTSWDRTPGYHRLVTPLETEKLFVYGYLYPRHIHQATRTTVGTVPFTSFI